MQVGERAPTTTFELSFESLQAPGSCISHGLYFRHGGRPSRSEKKRQSRSPKLVSRFMLMSLFLFCSALSSLCRACRGLAECLNVGCPCLVAPIPGRSASQPPSLACRPSPGRIPFPFPWLFLPSARRFFSQALPHSSFPFCIPRRPSPSLPGPGCGTRAPPTPP